ncbi:leukocyte-associated immunoglobulin-like receptor 1 isoform X6 [Suricata suricatta]|uniref:leukocyte-associated immunoglobulin-like receptor 1 isoform X6 n=1 Tax=Suricata suricatta TaxID=37032 RepID=UPI001155315E|nr:leukocyte-associated immunoglobulin-like receptor 1 isoform X6 [Suricata suricatta]
MCPHSTTFLALALCLGPGLHAQKGSLPPPLIHAEPGPEVPLGQRVTIVCRSLAAYEVFRLEKEGGVFQQDVHQRSPRNTEARFRIAAGTGAGGRYQCLYHVGDTWSDRSETLALVVTDTPGDVGCSPPRTCNPTDGRSTPRGSGDPSPVLQETHGRMRTTVRAQTCRQSMSIFSLGSRWPCSFASSSWLLPSSIASVGKNASSPAAKMRSRGPRKGSAQRLTSSRGHQIRQQLTDFLRRTGQRPAQPLLQEAPRT